MRRLIRLVTFRRLLFLVILAVLAGLGSGVWVRASAAGHVYTADAVPAAPVALVLGAQVHEDGHPSAFLVARLELAKKLLDTGKVRALLVSGDHMNWDYDEPSAMRDWLLAAGVPDRLIVRDYAGFDTYDSCHRAKQVFGVNHLIVVTQSFHVRRAVTLCRSAGIDADGVGDDTVRTFANYWWRGVAREQGADVKAVWDVAIRRKPVFLGPHETGIDTALATP